VFLPRPRYAVIVSYRLININQVQGEHYGVLIKKIKLSQDEYTKFYKNLHFNVQCWRSLDVVCIYHIIFTLIYLNKKSSVNVHIIRI
jgi:hypothetical protein